MTEDERLEAFNERMVIKGIALSKWLDQQCAYRGEALYLLMGLIAGMVEEGYPDEDNRPLEYVELMMALSDCGRMLGSMIAAVEMTEGGFNALMGLYGRPIH